MTSARCAMANTATRRDRHTIDATGQSFGRLASSVVFLLRGKQKTTFAPHEDGGDFVHITNLRAVRFTGTKLQHQESFRHSGWPRGLKATPLHAFWSSDPERMFRHAVRGMLPVNRQRPIMLKRLSIEL